MKCMVSSALLLGCLLGLAGCENSVDRPAPDTIPQQEAPVDPAPPGAEVETSNGDVDVQVGPPGEAPGVDLDVDREGDVDLNIDGEKIRERIQERRAERREELQESATPE